MRHYLNHGSADEPKLRVYLNLDNLADLRPDTLWPELEGDERMVRLRADGFDGVQVTSGEPPSLGVMPFCGLGDHRPSHQQLRKLPGNGVLGCLKSALLSIWTYGLTTVVSGLLCRRDVLSFSPASLAAPFLRVGNYGQEL